MLTEDLESEAIFRKGFGVHVFESDAWSEFFMKSSEETVTHTHLNDENSIKTIAPHVTQDLVKRFKESSGWKAAIFRTIGPVLFVK